MGVIEKSFITPADWDLQQLLRGIRSQRMNFERDTGAVNHLSVAYDPPLTTYTLGLTLRVLVRHTNDSAMSINAGAGRVPIRRMGGGIDLVENEVPAGAIITLAFDGSVFQLSNFGGGLGGDINISQVQIPYTRDVSTVPNVIEANFSPAITDLVAGDIIAVRIANTNDRPTRIHVNAISPIELRPNGGDGLPTMAGDLVEGDVVMFLFDGDYFWFAPNPEISSQVVYNIGPGGGDDFANVSDAMDALHRKTIGATGLVTLLLRPGDWSPVWLSHPSADRIIIRGTMASPTSAPREEHFARSGNTDTARMNDALFNRTMLLQRFLTRIILPYSSGSGVANYGPGLPMFQDLLILGPGPWYMFDGTGHYYVGSNVQIGSALTLRNVSIWGAEIGQIDNGNCVYQSVFCTGCSRRGFWTQGSGSSYQNCYAFGCGGPSVEVPSGAHIAEGWLVVNGNATLHWSSAQQNASSGLHCGNGAGTSAWWSRFVNNRQADLLAQTNASITVVFPNSITGVTSPQLGVTGNQNSVINTTVANWYIPNPWI